MKLYKHLNVDTYFDLMLVIFAVSLIPVLAFSLLLTEDYKIHITFGVAFVLEACLHTLYTILFFSIRKLLMLFS